MTDDELVEQFERGAIPSGSFRHGEHLRVAWTYLEKHGQAAAERRLLEMLRAFAVRAGKPDKFDAALTRAWIAALDHARLTHPEIRTFEALAAVRPDLLDPRSVGPRHTDAR